MTIHTKTIHTNSRIRLSVLVISSFLFIIGLRAVNAATVEVTVQDFRFTPASVSIKPGDTVRWRWLDGTHTITSGSNCAADGRYNFDASGPGNGSEFTFQSAGTFPYFCVPHCRAGMTGSVVVSAAQQPATRIEDPIPAGIGRGNIAVKLQRIAQGLTAPNGGTAPPGDTSRLFVTDQTGTIWAINLATQQKTEFANLKSLLVPLGVGGSAFDERGLLGLAFHPDYQSNGLLYTYTSEPANATADFSTLPAQRSPDHQSVIREWRVTSPADPATVVDPGSSRVVLRINQPQFNHNGGALSFGADNLLYIALGDGGNADDQGRGHVTGGNAQSLGNVLGKILRIDPNLRTAVNGQYGVPPSNPFIPTSSAATGGQSGCADDQCDEIYAYGLRNPFRISFDRERGDLYAADVGQNDIEEVDVIVSGGNYGWRQKEGRFCFNPNGQGNGFVTAPANCTNPSLVDPIAQYDHDDGIAIVGGFVYRGQALPELRGHYVFGDYARTFNADGRLFYLKRRDVVAVDAKRSGIAEFKLRRRQQLGMALLGFAQDGQGELYVLANRTGLPRRKTGSVWRIDK